MSDDVLIKVENVSKKFCGSLKKSMLYGIKDIARETLSLKNNSSKLRPKEFWAVQDVSFEVKRGECLGIIGRNGAGKSTLLKMLNGIYMPDIGQITIKGKVCALIEVGAGFHPMLSGKENIYINGAILGLSKHEIDKKYDEIVAFAELEEFIDMPVKYYSSGMYVRLGFAIAIQMEPDVLILDEVLAVGDINFWVKSFNAITDILNDCAVIFVSHNMGQISRICTSALVMNRGQMQYIGDNVVRGIELYNDFVDSSSSVHCTSTDEASIVSVMLHSQGKNDVTSIEHGSAFSVRFKVNLDKRISRPTANIVFIAQDGRIIAQANSVFNGAEIRNEGDQIEIFADFVSACFNPGRYTLVVAVMDENFNKIIARREDRGKLVIRGDFYGGAPVQLISEWSYLQVSESDSSTCGSDV